MFMRVAKHLEKVTGKRHAAPGETLSDLDILRANHRFIRSEEDENGSWEARLAKQYYDRLHQEYVVGDLAGYKKGRVGFRWRTDREVVQGKGQFFCGSLPCSSRVGLRSYEVYFKYVEQNAKKEALVKVRLCARCGYKLNYKHMRKRRKARPAAAEEQHAAAAGASAPKAERDAPRVKAEPESDGESSGPEEDDLAKLDELAWRGPRKEDKTREDEIDEFLADMIF
jgi:protein FRA10AC1